MRQQPSYVTGACGLIALALVALMPNVGQGADPPSPKPAVETELPDSMVLKSTKGRLEKPVVAGKRTIDFLHHFTSRGVTKISILVFNDDSPFFQYGFGWKTTGHDIVPIRGVLYRVTDVKTETKEATELKLRRIVDRDLLHKYAIAPNHIALPFGGSVIVKHDDEFDTIDVQGSVVPSPSHQSPSAKVSIHGTISHSPSSDLYVVPTKLHAPQIVTARKGTRNLRGKIRRYRQQDRAS